MHIVVLNYSKVLGSRDLNRYIIELIDNLAHRGIGTENIRVESASPQLYEEIMDIINSLEDHESLISDKRLNKICDKYYVEMGIYIVIIGENLPTQNPWGDAQGAVCVIKKVEKAVVWHEIAHLMGAEDHYTQNHGPTDSCKRNDCLMRYGILAGDFCEQAIDEIKKSMTTI